ncbi:MAG: YdeI/OmpD-associated family protein [Pyrinomonadaceae bacterium]|nr:YdeI/OmpD-associated family protein [Pyrinomonadaceae bacterium]MBP6213444.1 YdeI/OmpD-associated family protein [Pyrinomonadaceae bacterium]
MPTTDPRVDAYIEKSKDFAKPILTHIRALVHATCPEATETLKWSMPSFEYKGILCGFAAFKEHCTFGFWKQTLMESDAFSETKTAMGSFGKLKSLKDLPSDAVMKKLIKQAMKLNDEGVKVSKAKPSGEKKEIEVPDVLLEALAQNEKAAETFSNFPPSCRKEYIQWIIEAKTDATRDKRLATTIEWLTEGKRKNWKYEKC